MYNTWSAVHSTLQLQTNRYPLHLPTQSEQIDSCKYKVMLKSFKCPFVINIFGSDVGFFFRCVMASEKQLLSAEMLYSTPFTAINVQQLKIYLLNSCQSLYIKISHFTVAL